jgi:hypothetical protein
MMRVAFCTNASRHVNLDLTRCLTKPMATAMSEPPNAMATAEDEHLAKEIEMLSDDLSIDLQQYLDDISTVGNL